MKLLKSEQTLLQESAPLIEMPKPLDQLSEILIKRIGETYKKGKIDSLALLFSSEDFSEFISRYKYLRVMQLHDRKLMIQMETVRTNYADQKTLKEEKQEALEFAKKKLESEKALLAQQKVDKERFLEVTQNNERRYQELLAVTRAELEAIQSIIKKIPKLPIFASGLTSKLMGTRASASEVAEDVKNDPSLVGIVLKTVNSAYYSFQKKVSDIQHAIVLLGFNEIYSMIIAQGVRETMPNTLSFRELHAHSVAISNIAYSISNHVKTGKPSELATVGLLHDVGQIVIELLKEQIKIVKQPTIKAIFEQILEDERRHHKILMQVIGDL